MEQRFSDTGSYCSASDILKANILVDTYQVAQIHHMQFSDGPLLTLLLYSLVLVTEVCSRLASANFTGSLFVFNIDATSFTVPTRLRKDTLSHLGVDVSSEMEERLLNAVNIQNIKPT